MKFDAKATELIARYAAEPADTQAQFALFTLWWTVLAKGIGDTLRAGNDALSFLDAERDLFDLGLVPELDAGFDRAGILGYGIAHFVTVLSFTDWVKKVVSRITSGDRRALLDQEIAALHLDLRHAETELAEAQSRRLELLSSEFASDRATISWVESLSESDMLTRRNLGDKRRMSKGAKFTAEDRRDLAARELNLAKLLKRGESVLSQCKTPQAKKAMQEAFAGVVSAIERTVICDDVISRKMAEIEKISALQDAISPAEIDAGLARELDYMKDVVKLSARRMHAEPLPLLRAGVKPFTRTILKDALDRILEFDPLLFKNDRIGIVGRPAVLLIPGYGNGMYDWKNNLLVIPLLPPAGAHMASVAAACIEYRLDVDEDKRLMGTFCALPEQKTIRSQVTLRENLTKEYVRWMTSEYEGFKVLPKDTRAWFEHEIGPKRTELVCPPQWQSFEWSSGAFSARVRELEAIVGENAAGGSDREVFELAILDWQQGQFEKTWRYLTELEARGTSERFVVYNLGITAIKVGRKQEAISAFCTFAERNPQGFWAAAARDFVRRLQMA